MKNLRIIATAILFLTLCSIGAMAQETDSSLIAKQKAVLNSLDSIEKNSLGFALNGRAKAGVLTSVASSDYLSENASEHLAFTDLLLSISIRPSNETRALFDLRFHKDWQNAYREGNNSPIITWWSYDGLILDKKLKFNLGTMRVGYTPLTMATPNPDFIFEPQIFADRRAEAMADRYLDGSDKRLLQGLNAEFSSPLGGFIDNIFIQGTLARLHNNAKKGDQIFFDIDREHDRYAAAAKIGAEAFGFNIGIIDVYSFDRVSSNRSKSTTGASMRYGDSANYEFNNVLSFTGGANSKKMLSGPVSFGINAELAISNWNLYRDYWKSEPDTVISLGILTYPIPCLQCPDDIYGELRYPYYGTSNNSNIPVYSLSKITGLRNQSAFLADAFVDYSNNSIEAKLSGHYLKTDVGFESELAASPSYLPTMPILNSDVAFESSAFDAVLEQFRSGSLEYLYYSLYYTLPQNASSIIFTNSATGVPSNTNNFNLYNNYKLGQYYKNAYSFRTYTYLERQDIAGNLDPSVNMALPYGYATPDRHGGDADFSINWNNAVLLRGIFGKYASDASDYTRFGGGVSVKIARLADLPKPLDVSVSFEQNTEKDGLEREATRIMAGFNAGIWRGFYWLGGIQLLDKKFGVPYGDIVTETSEMLVLSGPSVKMSERAYFVLQGGLLTNSIKAVSGEELDISKYLFSATVTVGF